jgi:undecaprenyl-phosphate 4-deoxy-4-formamido-L-arabinose transferase
MKPSVSVVIPVYRGAPTLESLVIGLIPVLTKICSKFEVILVNDDSPDESWQIINNLSKKNSIIKGIRLMRNFGQHNATLCGVRAAKYPICITLDDDLQHPPTEIHKLLEKMDEGFDVVYGTPIKQPQGLLRNLITSWTKRTLAYVMGIPNLRNISAFRCFRTDLRKAFDQYQSPNVTLDVLLSWATTRFASIPVGILPPPEHRSNYNYRSLIRYTLLVLTGYSTAPLRFASIMGFVMTLVGIGVFIYVISIFMFAGSIPGFPFLVSIIAIFGGTQLFALGIFGEYLARIFTRSMDKPTYVISDQTGSQEKNRG